MNTWSRTLSFTCFTSRSSDDCRRHNTYATAPNHRTSGFVSWCQSLLKRGCRTALPRSGRQEIAFLFRLLLELISFIVSSCGNVIEQWRILKQLVVPKMDIYADIRIENICKESELFWYGEKCCRRSMHWFHGYTYHNNSYPLECKQVVPLFKVVSLDIFHFVTM